MIKKIFKSDFIHRFVYRNTNYKLVYYDNLLDNNKLSDNIKDVQYDNWCCHTEYDI
jgi:hypothetical protein